MKTEPENDTLAMLAQLISEIRGQGHFLRYDEYELLRSWAESGVETDMLGATIFEVLTPYFAKHGSQKSLLGAKRQITKRLQALNSLY